MAYITKRGSSYSVRYTYQEISDAMAEKGWPVSKSAIHRYAVRTEAAAERIRAAAEQTRILIQSVKDGQDVEATEVASALLLDGLIKRLATAEEEFDDLPLDKAGRLLVQLMAKGKPIAREPLEAARERHTRVRAELPLAAHKMSKGDPALPTILLDEVGEVTDNPYAAVKR